MASRARRAMAFQQFDMRGVDMAAGQAGKAGDHGARRAAAHFLEKRDGGHQRASRPAAAGTKIAMTMPSLRQTVKESAAGLEDHASRRWRSPRPTGRSAGSAATLRPMLKASVRA